MLSHDSMSFSLYRHLANRIGQQSRYFLRFVCFFCCFFPFFYSKNENEKQQKGQKIRNDYRFKKDDGIRTYLWNVCVRTSAVYVFGFFSLSFYSLVANLRWQWTNEVKKKNIWFYRYGFELQLYYYLIVNGRSHRSTKEEEEEKEISYKALSNRKKSHKWHKKTT